LLGALLTVPIAEFIPTLGVPALTAPFVIAAWAVLTLHWCEKQIVTKAQ
jgi:urea transporter